MDWYNASEAGLWAAIWGMGFVAALCRVWADDSFVGLRLSLATACVSGFLGCIAVSVANLGRSISPGSEWPYIFLSALIGIGGKQLQGLLLSHLFSAAMKKLGLSFEDEKESDEDKE